MGVHVLREGVGVKAFLTEDATFMTAEAAWGELGLEYSGKWNHSAWGQGAVREFGGGFTH